MATVQDLKRRIRSVRNTRKITRAMELVAAAKLRRAEQRITALRPYAETMNELIAGVGRAASSVRLPLLERRETRRGGRDRPADRRSRARGLVQRPGHPPRLRARARARGRGQDRPLGRRGKKGRSTLTFRRRELSGAYHRLHRSTRVRERAGDRASRRRALHGGRGRSRRARLQHVRLRAHAEGHRAGRAPDLSGHPRDRRRRARRRTRCAATSSSSRSPRRSSSACSPCTSRRRSTARCSSRPRPSRARG